MSAPINFAGVDVAKDMSMTYPGTIAVFKIADAVFGDSTNKGTRYLKCTFEELDEAGKSITNFSDSFYLTQGALPRLQSLIADAVGKKADGNVTEEQLVVMLKGKKVALKVIGQVSSNGKGYPKLGFGGFSKPASEVQFLSFNKQDKDSIEAAKAAIASSQASNADAESGAPKAEFASDKAF